MSYKPTKDEIAEEMIEHLKDGVDELSSFWETYFAADTPGDAWGNYYREMQSRVTCMLFLFRTVSSVLLAAYDMPPEWLTQEMETLMCKGEAVV